MTAFPKGMEYRKRGKMQDTWYLLSVAELLAQEGDSALWERCMSRLDGERCQRAAQSRTAKKRAENVGAGLLLQLAVHEALSEQQGRQRRFTISEILALLEWEQQEPLLLEYTYGGNGKPYLKSHPYFFNISHSEETVLLAISESEIGADIQWRKPMRDFRMAERFFTPEEQRKLREYKSKTESHAFFYRLWTRKEAYGKLTGEGIARVLSDGMPGMSEKIVFEECEIENYQIAICKWKSV